MKLTDGSWHAMLCLDGLCADNLGAEWFVIDPPRYSILIRYSDEDVQQKLASLGGATMP
ncbi:MAG: hypothetical protein V7629_17120 [Motiliproteus sp.]